MENAGKAEAALERRSSNDAAKSKDHKCRRLILFPGLGADGSMFNLLRSNNFSVYAPPLPEPAARESLPQYAARVAARLEQSEGIHVWTECLIGGASFGGMLATEIARQKGARGLILLGSTIHPARIPRLLRWVERWGRYLPDRMIHGGKHWGKRVLAVKRGFKGEAREIFATMGEATPRTFIKRAGSMIFRWEGLSAVPCPTIHLHGSRDWIIRPPEYFYYRLEKAGHVFVLSHPTETVRILEEALAARL